MSFSLNDFASTYFAPALIILGTIGDVFGLIVVSKKKMKKIGPQITYMALFISDFITFATIFQPYAAYAFNIDVTLFSSIACKSYLYVNYVTAPISPMLSVYISIERYVSIAYPRTQQQPHFLQKKKIQLAYIFALILFTLAFYAPVGIFYDLVDVLFYFEI